VALCHTFQIIKNTQQNIEANKESKESAETNLTNAKTAKKQIPRKSAARAATAATIGLGASIGGYLNFCYTVGRQVRRIKFHY
jgi:hypothetical protein